ncbi:MAG: archaellin/type IV pilin N-terminal domain-containing protein [Thermoplasmata archaeon]
MKQNWKDRKAVSPVIATILMVAITVVLAAVLIVYMQSMTTPPPAGSGDMRAESTYRLDAGAINWTITIQSCPAGLKTTETTWQIKNPSTGVISKENQLASSIFKQETVDGQTIYSCKFLLIDNSASGGPNGYLDPGDCIYLNSTIENSYISPVTGPIDHNWVLIIKKGDSIKMEHNLK